MPSYTLETTSGTIPYTLKRRGEYWHYDFRWQARRVRSGTDEVDLRLAKIAAARAIELAVGAGLNFAKVWTLAEAVEDYLEARWDDPVKRKRDCTFKNHSSRLRIWAGTNASRNHSGAEWARFVAITEAGRQAGKSWREIFSDAKAAGYRGKLQALRKKWRAKDVAVSASTENSALTPPSKPELGTRGGLNLLAMTCDELAGMVQQYINERNRVVEPLSVKSDQGIISRFFTWTMEMPPRLKLPRNPAFARSGMAPGGLTLKKVPTRVKPAANADAVDEAMKMARTRPLYPVLVLLQSGLRPISCERVRWCDLSLGDKPTVRIFEKSVEAYIPLCSWAASALAELKLRTAPASEEMLLYPYTRYTAFHQMARLREELGNPAAFSLQALRRLTYQRLYEAGVNVQLAARIMRSSIATAMKHYVNLETLNAHDEVEALSAMGGASRKDGLKSRADAASASARETRGHKSGHKSELDGTGNSTQVVAG